MKASLVLYFYIMKKIDYSKFRFKIGDTVFVKGCLTKILGYYFSLGFNNYRYYGYVIEKEGSHDGSNLSYDEYGNKLKFKKKNAYFINEKDAIPIKEININLDPFKNAKPGDKVKIKKRIGNECDYQFYFGYEMNLQEGKIYIIKAIYNNISDSSYKFPAKYHIVLEDSPFTWSDAMLELVKSDKNIVSTSIKSTIDIIKNVFKKEETNISLIVKKSKPKLKFDL